MSISDASPAPELPLSELQWTLGFTDPAHVRRHATAVGESGPTRSVSRGDGALRPLPERPLELGSLVIDDAGRTLETFLADADSDGLLVLHRGRIVYERYLHGFGADRPHLTASMAKAFVGLVAGAVEQQGLFHRDDLTSRYVPELRGTAFGDASIGGLLDMTTPVAYDDRPFRRDVEARRWWAVVAPGMRPDGYDGPATLMDRLLTARATGPYGEHFLYENGNSEALGAVLARISGTTLSDLLSDLVWSRIGAAQDGRYVLDEAGVETACGGFAATLRDIALIGETMRCGGALDGAQIVPEAVVGSLTTVPDGATARVRLPRASASSPATMSYRDYWWILNDPFGSFMASGIHGQRLFISPGLDLVVAHFGSQIISPSVPPPPFASAFARVGLALRG